MYVVATCGVFVVGVKFDADYLAFADIDGIKKEFIDSCLSLFSTRDEKVANVKIDSASDTSPLVTALTFMDKYTDADYKVIRKQMTDALKDSILSVYTKVYEREIMRKVDALRNQLGCHVD